jgi:hypothetical protein
MEENNMSKLITVSNLSKFWTNTKSYIDTALNGKANATHTHDYAATSHSHTEYAATSHTHDYAASNHSHSEYALKTEIPESVEVATDAEIDALFA